MRTSIRRWAALALLTPALACGGDDSNERASSTEPDADLRAVRLGAAVSVDGSSVWTAGGAIRDGSGWRAAREVLRYGADGTLVQRSVLPLAELDMLSNPTFVDSDEDGLILTGQTCVLAATSENSGCLSDPIATAYSVTPEGVTELSLPLPLPGRYEFPSFEAHGAFGPATFVLEIRTGYRTENVSKLHDTGLRAWNVQSGELSTIDTPVVTRLIDVCVTDERIYALDQVGDGVDTVLVLHERRFDAAWSEVGRRPIAAQFDGAQFTLSCDGGDVVVIGYVIGLTSTTLITPMVVDGGFTEATTTEVPGGTISERPGADGIILTVGAAAQPAHVISVRGAEARELVTLPRWTQLDVAELDGRLVDISAATVFTSRGDVEFELLDT